MNVNGHETGCRAVRCCAINAPKSKLSLTQAPRWLEHKHSALDTRDQRLKTATRHGHVDSVPTETVGGTDCVYVYNAVPFS